MVMGISMNSLKLFGLFIVLTISLAVACGNDGKNNQQSKYKASDPGKEPPFGELFLLNAYHLYEVDRDYDLAILQYRDGKTIYYRLKKTADAPAATPTPTPAQPVEKPATVTFSVQQQIGVDVQSILEWEFKKTGPELLIGKVCDISCRDEWKITRQDQTASVQVPTPTPTPAAGTPPPEVKEEKYAALEVKSFSLPLALWSFSRKGNEFITIVPPSVKERAPGWQLKPETNPTPKVADGGRQEQALLVLTPDVVELNTPVQQWSMGLDLSQGDAAKKWIMHTQDYTMLWSANYRGEQFVVQGWEGNETWNITNKDRKDQTLPLFKTDLINAGDQNSAALFYFFMIQWIKANRVLENIDEILKQINDKKK